MLVGVTERLADLLGDAQGSGQGRAVLRRLLDQPLDVAAAHELADQVRLAVLLAHVVDGDDVRVPAEAAHDSGLAVDALDADLVEALGLDQREGDIAVEQRVVGQIDLLLAAFAQEAFDLIAAIREGGGEFRWGGG